MTSPLSLILAALALIGLSGVPGLCLDRLRLIQGGVTQHYLLYILTTVIVLLAWTMPWSLLLARLHTP